MATQAIREADDQGRHTTSHRQLVLLPGGGLIVDTPGVREVGLIDADEGLSMVFDDIERLAETCRFNDCGHANEPGCAVRGALESGALDPTAGRTSRSSGLNWRRWRRRPIARPRTPSAAASAGFRRSTAPRRGTTGAPTDLLGPAQVSRRRAKAKVFSEFGPLPRANGLGEGVQTHER
jgi:hypothetical protein